MKKSNNIIISFLLSIILVVVFSTNIAASNIKDFSITETSKGFDNTDIIELKMVNIHTVSQQNKGLYLAFDLVQEIQSSHQETPATMVDVGDGVVGMRLKPSNGIGYFDWHITLTNGDLITRVKGTFVCEKI